MPILAGGTQGTGEALSSSSVYLDQNVQSSCTMMPGYCPSKVIYHSSVYVIEAREWGGVHTTI